MSSKWEQVGSMRVKDGRYYLKIDQNIPAGTILQMEKPLDKIDRLEKLGHLTPEKADERRNNVPDYIKFDLIMPPPKTDDKF